MKLTSQDRGGAEVIGGTAPGHDLTVGQVRAAVAAAGFRCSHVADFGMVCDPCLPGVAIHVALFHDRLSGH